MSQSNHSPTQSGSGITAGLRATVIGIGVNAALAPVKGVAGFFGNSYALIADAIESLSDIFSSCIVLLGLKMAEKPPDAAHPHGHGKFEPLAGAAVVLILMAAAILIAVESVREILRPHHTPASFTLIVLAITILAKEWLSRYGARIGAQLKSTAVKSDAAHHRSDILTSVAAFVGISIALVGGPGYESTDDFAALIAAGIIAVNAVLILKPAIDELVDTAPDPHLVARVRSVAESVPGVFGTHKCHVRKIGFDYFVALDIPALDIPALDIPALDIPALDIPALDIPALDIPALDIPALDILCDPESTIRGGHEIAHRAGAAIHEQVLEITKVLVHVEPVDDYGRR